MAEVLAQNISIWFLIWICAWGTFYFLRTRDVDYVSNFELTAGYFLLISIVVIFYFHDIFFPLIKDARLVPIFIFAFLYFSSFWLYYYTKKHYKRPVSLIKKSWLARSFLVLDYRHLASKPFEILFQQVMIILLVLILNSLGFSLGKITLIFASIFGLGHLPILTAGEYKWGILFISASVLAAILFPFLIIKVNYGFVYTYTIHFMFYVFLGVIFWRKKSRN